MGKFNPAGLLPLAIPVGLGVGYFFDCFGMCTGFKAAVDGFIGSILGGGGNGGGDDDCTLTCTAPKVLDEDACACVDPPAGCTTTCTAPKILNAACECVDPPATGGVATVTVDKTLYVAGNTIAVTGSGFGASEVVGCRYTAGGALVLAKDVTANATGGFSTTFTATAGGHITCTGRTSAKVGQALVAFKASAYTYNSFVVTRERPGFMRPLRPMVVRIPKPQIVRPTRNVIMPSFANSMDLNSFSTMRESRVNMR